MNVTIKNLPKSQVELTITISPAEQQPFLLRAAEKISNEIKVLGFRPGKAPYDVVAAQVGEMKIMEQALEIIVRATFVDAVKTHELHTIGTPEVTFEKLAPHNDIVYRAVVSLLPNVTLPDFKKISVAIITPTVSEKEIENVLTDMRRMHAVVTDVAAGVAASAHDQITLDLDLLDGAVPLEGGAARGHVVHLNEPYYIPGFTEKLVGAHVGDALEFVLPFPTEHYQKVYAGKNITFKVRVTKIESRAQPDVDESFAKKLGYDSVIALREQIQKNIFEEQRRRAEETAEIDMLKRVVAATQFNDLPDNMIENERHKIMQELLDSLRRNGIGAERYFSDMKKTSEEILAGFTNQATERVKMGIVTFAIAQEHKIEISKEELQEELKAIRESYHDNKDALQRLLTAEVQDMVLSSMRNRKVVEWMKEKMLKTD